MTNSVVPSTTRVLYYYCPAARIHIRAVYYSILPFCFNLIVISVTSPAASVAHGLLLLLPLRHAHLLTHLLHHLHLLGRA